MGSKSFTYDNRLEIIREISRSIACQTSNNIEELLNSALGMIGNALNCNVCMVFGINEAGSFDLLNCYDKKRMPYVKDFLNSNCSLVLDTIQRKQTNYKCMETSNNIYFVPMMNHQPASILLFNCKKKLEAKEMELIESVSSIFSSAIDKVLLKQQLRQQYLSTVKSLVIAIEAKDVYTQGHSQRVAHYSKIIGKHLNLKDEEIDELEITGLVHDIGKIGISDSLLTKPNRLTELEFDTIKQHPEIGSKILMPLGVSENVMMGTLLHHKRYDLKGYPNNLKIDSLPLVPAIIGVADAFDAMTSERTYKETISKKAALLELKKHRGTQFDPAIVDVVEELLKSDIL